MFRFYVLLVPLYSAYGALLYANLGDDVTLPCFYASSAKHLCWYKQVAGEPPQIISSFYKHLRNSISFHNQFKDDTRLSVHAGGGFYHLNISNVQSSDSAMYYCGQTSITVTEFDKGTLLILKESGRRSFLQQPQWESVHPGGSATLNCTVLTGTSDGEHSVYWFKKHSGSSHLGIMYIPAQHSGQCVGSSECGSPARSCVYTLSKRDVTPADAGTYYCAVASCGEVLFGNGTRLDVGGKHFDTTPVVVHCVVAALVVSVTLNIILFVLLCNMARTKYLHSEGLHPQLTAESTTDSQNEGPNAEQYVALDFRKRLETSRREKSTEEQTIYSGVKLSHLE